MFHSYLRHLDQTATSSPLASNHLAKNVASFYNFPPPPITAPAIAIVSLGGTYLTSDLLAYRKLQGLAGAPNITVINTGKMKSRPDQKIIAGDGTEENTLDLQIASSISPTSPIYLYFGDNTLDGYYQALQGAITGPAKIISTSWGGPESSYGGKTGIQRYEVLMRQAQALGKIVVAAAGDAGSGDGTRSLAVDYPASSPYVIACGGTTLLPNGTETAWSWNPSKQWGGGGGISSYFPPPSYQQKVIPTYSGRASPDLSLLADPLTGWSIYYQGVLNLNSWGGTSCVSPAIAGLLACCNLESYANLHPDIYNANKTLVFRDVLVGDNDSLPDNQTTYRAVQGYDLVTGWGSVHGTNFSSALKKQPIVVQKPSSLIFHFSRPLTIERIVGAERTG